MAMGMAFLLVPLAVAGTQETKSSSVCCKGQASANSSKQMNDQQANSKMQADKMHSKAMAAEGKSEQTMAVRASYKRADHLIGTPVVGRAGERLGTIEDIVLDNRDNSISYAVLSYGGFLGFRDKLFAVPWSEFQPASQKEGYVLDVRKEYLKDAPGFAKNHWPNMADQNWAQDIAKFYRQGRQGAGKAEGMSSSNEPMMAQSNNKGQIPVTYRRVSRLIGLPAKDYQGQSLGDLDDIVINTANNKVTYGVVILNTTPWALNRKLAIVPWNTIEVVPELSALRLDADESMLEAVAFTRGAGFPYLGDPMYAQGVEKQFEATPYWETLGYIPGNGPTATEMKPGKMTKTVKVAAWKASSAYNQRFDPGLVTTVRGTICSIGVFKLEGTPVEGLRLGVKTPDGQVRAIHVGPRQFIESQGIALHFGDEVTVTGAPSRYDAWRGEFLMASTIQCGDQTCRIRSANGTPQWNVDRLTGSSSSSR